MKTKKLIKLLRVNHFYSNYARFFTYKSKYANDNPTIPFSDSASKSLLVYWRAFSFLNRRL
ncbi:hypothetical protein ADIS_0987 [Lunatimonas lonarensis]|uniref:Uncharacterized protein n=1 Tax=Lunatimonas lonarensis TaxID=1232681 RepID=R7ZWX4_9BACT|nr:hypothetical protein ADIS_0987 [Lunatimonas lonarensis]